MKNMIEKNVYKILYDYLHYFLSLLIPLCYICMYTQITNKSVFIPRTNIFLFLVLYYMFKPHTNLHHAIYFCANHYSICSANCPVCNPKSKYTKLT